MTLDEFKEKTKHLEGEYHLTVRKYDKNQLCCSATIPIENVEVGIDWEHGQIVLTPSEKLVTDPGVVDKRKDNMLKEYSSRCSTYLRIAAKLARIIDGMQDGDDKENLKSVVREFAHCY